MTRFAGNPRVRLLDADGATSRFGKARAFNPTLYNLARMPWHEGVLPYLADEIVRYVYAHLGRTKKCLVLDLDNTLWGGVVGEDGPDGIEVGPGGAIGEGFEAFQRAILAVRDRGVLLAINSKNNADDVDEVFRLKPDMPLKLGDFSSCMINWQPKHENLIAIAKELNIGVDSLVFVDDNPVECTLVEEMLPEVQVVQLPKDPAQYADLLRDLVAFEKLSITAEDRVKSAQYQQQRERAAHRESVGDIESYLASLATTVKVRTATEANQARIHQMFSKTNQFNLTTKRYTPAEIERFITDDRYVLRTIDASDRFGALGIIGLYLVDLDREQPYIDSFVMSCRAIGRGIETAVMNGIKQEFLISQRHEALVADFVPTKKNVPARDFYQSQGFMRVEETNDGGQSFRLGADTAQPIDCPHVTID
ncbi:MAG: HAD-IIIC family phosphatase, partial [Pseudomonadota bacterium]